MVSDRPDFPVTTEELDSVFMIKDKGSEPSKSTVTLLLNGSVMLNGSTKSCLTAGFDDTGVFPAFLSELFTSVT